MRETPLSTCEREFILKSISEKRRLDGRKAYDYRDIRVTFGVTLGCCHVEIGKTKVLAQVSCSVGQPKATRPQDGCLYVNVELSPMASPAFEQGRQSDESVELSRLMERCLKESRCLDMESLCIVAGEKVWEIRVDIHVLNHEGNILDCASLAAVSALAHFKCPDVTVQGQEVTIHTLKEKPPVPLSIHHYPLLVSFAFFTQGKYLLLDPSEKEEKVMEGKMVVGMNKHREICTLQVTGEMLLMKDQVLRCSNIAVTKVTAITELIQHALENDREARAKGEKHGFAELVSSQKVTAHRQPETKVDVKEETMEDEEEEDESGDSDSEEEKERKRKLPLVKTKASPVEIVSSGVGAIGEGGASKWLDLPALERKKAGIKAQISKKGGDALEQDDDSEEEAQVVLKGLT